MNFYKPFSKRIIITCGDNVITSKDMESEQFELTESINSGYQLHFGSVEASMVRFRLRNIDLRLKGKEITIYIDNVNTGENFCVGTYKVDSDAPDADRNYREIVAFDKLYDVIQADVAEWYNALTFPMELSDFRHSFAEHFGIIEEETTLINDSIPVNKTIETESISGYTVLSAICEANACFPHITRDGKLRYITLKKLTVGLYPREDLYPAEDLFPADTEGALVRSEYRIRASYEDYVTKEINKLTVRTDTSDTGVTVGTGDNGYIIQNNFILYGYSESNLTTVANKIFEAIKNISFRPAEINAVGNLDINVGDGVYTFGKKEAIRTYVFQRVLTGIQALRDTYTANGTEEAAPNLRSLAENINNLSGKTNVLTKDLEKTQSTLTDTAAGLQTQITQTAGRVESVATTANGAYSIASQTASEITNYVKLGKDYAGMKITSSGIEIKTNGTFTVESGKFGINASGEMFCTAGTIGIWHLSTYGSFESEDGDYYSIISPDGAYFDYGGGTKTVYAKIGTFNGSAGIEVSNGTNKSSISATSVSTTDVSASNVTATKVSLNSISAKIGTQVVNKTVTWKQKSALSDTDYVLVGS